MWHYTSRTEINLENNARRRISPFHYHTETTIGTRNSVPEDSQLGREAERNHWTKLQMKPARNVHEILQLRVYAYEFCTSDDTEHSANAAICFIKGLSRYWLETVIISRLTRGFGLNPHTNIITNELSKY